MSYYLMWAVVYLFLGLAWFDRHPDLFKTILKHAGGPSAAIVTANIIILTWVGWWLSYQYHLRKENHKRTPRR